MSSEQNPFVIKKARDAYDVTPLRWWPLLYAATKHSDAKRTAYVTCPNGHSGTLIGHEIADDGTVSPSVKCGLGEAVCPWHEHIKLEGWTP